MHCDHKMGRRVVLAAGLGAFVVAIAIPSSDAAAQRGETAITCTNPLNGASWQIRIDYDRSTVDSNPARISDSEISWRDANRWNLTLDRKSGNLTVILASSTGGSFLYHRCKLEN
jgi:hypothetical protein